MLTFAAVTSLLITGCAAGQSSTSRQAEGVTAGLVGSEQPSASSGAALLGSDGEANTDSDETADESSEANQASPEATPRENDSESIEPIESIEPTDNRVAGYFANRMRVCVTNDSSSTIAVRWSPSMLTGRKQSGLSPEYLPPDQLKKTLGPGAFVCAASHATDAGTEDARLYIEGQETTIVNSGQEFLVYFEDRKSRDWVLTPNAPMTFTWPSGITDDRMIEARVTTTGKLEPFDQIQAYPIDFHVSDAR